MTKKFITIKCHQYYLPDFIGSNSLLNICFLFNIQ